MGSATGHFACFTEPADTTDDSRRAHINDRAPTESRDEPTDVTEYDRR